MPARKDWSVCFLDDEADKDAGSELEDECAKDLKEDENDDDSEVDHETGKVLQIKRRIPTATESIQIHHDIPNVLYFPSTISPVLDDIWYCTVATHDQEIQY